MYRNQRSGVELRRGDVLGRWTVEDTAPTSGSGERQVLCRCACGTIRPVRVTKLLRGESRQCKQCGIVSGHAVMSSRSRDAATQRLATNTRECPCCSKTFPLEKFSRSRNRPDGRVSYCKECESFARRRAVLGITKEQQIALYIHQNGCCALCSNPFVAVIDPGTHCDHDHVTGQIRGFLCDSCNRLFLPSYEKIRASTPQGSRWAKAESYLTTPPMNTCPAT
jgi:hypothetical protein